MHVFFSLLEENRWGEREYCTDGVTHPHREGPLTAEEGNGIAVPVPTCGSVQGVRLLDFSEDMLNQWREPQI